MIRTIGESDWKGKRKRHTNIIDRYCTSFVSFSSFFFLRRRLLLSPLLLLYYPISTCLTPPSFLLTSHLFAQQSTPCSRRQLPHNLTFFLCSSSSPTFLSVRSTTKPPIPSPSNHLPIQPASQSASKPNDHTTLLHPPPRRNRMVPLRETHRHNRHPADLRRRETGPCDRQGTRGGRSLDRAGEIGSYVSFTRATRVASQEVFTKSIFLFFFSSSFDSSSCINGEWD